MQDIRELSIRALDKYVVVTLQIGYWTGEKKIDLKDVSQDDLGPLVKGLLKVGNVQDISAIDRRARYTLDQYAVQFGPLKLVPEKSLESLIAYLESIKTQFISVASMIAQDYPNKLEAVKKEYPHLTTAIEKYFPMDIQDKFYFKWNLLRIIPQTENDKDALAKALIDANVENFQDVIDRLKKISETGQLNARLTKGLEKSIDKALDNSITEDEDYFTQARQVLYGGKEIDSVVVSRAIEEVSSGLEDLKQGVVRSKVEPTPIVERGE